MIKFLTCKIAVISLIWILKLFAGFCRFKADENIQYSFDGLGTKKLTSCVPGSDLAWHVPQLLRSWNHNSGYNSWKMLTSVQCYVSYLPWIWGCFFAFKNRSFILFNNIFRKNKEIHAKIMILGTFNPPPTISNRAERGNF